MTVTDSSTTVEGGSRGRNLWSLDEYVVAADLYLRRGRSSGVQDLEVLELAMLTQRSPASISRRLGNFDGTVRSGRGLKPIVGEPLEVFNRMRADDSYRQQIVGEARARLQAVVAPPAIPIDPSPRLVDPESAEVEESAALPPLTSGLMIRAEAQLVRRYRHWLDPRGTRLRGLVIPAEGGLLRADLFDTTLNVLIEAKAEASRPYLRYAIGQLFDYCRYVVPPPRPALLLPQRPSANLEALVARV